MNSYEKKIRNRLYTILGIFTLVLAIVLPSCKSVNSGDNDTAATLSQRLQTQLESFTERYNLARGISAAAIIPGRETWTGTDGYSTQSPERAIQPGMLFGIGSCSKSYTAALLLKLAEEDLLDLDDPIGDYLPVLDDYPNIDGSITIRRLLNHTSGIYNFTSSSSFNSLISADFERLITPDDILPLIMGPYFAPGAGWRYSNTNYYLAGMIVESVTGTAIPTVFRDRIFTPLGLGGTFFGAWETIPDAFEFAHGWYGSSDISQRSRNAVYSAASTAGGIVATASNLVTWVKTLFDGDFINQASLDQMTDFSSNNYGLGCSLRTMEGREVWAHGGAIDGYRTLFIYDPANGVSIAILINDSTDTYMEAMMGDLFRIVIEDL